MTPADHLRPRRADARWCAGLAGRLEALRAEARPPRDVARFRLVAMAALSSGVRVRAVRGASSRRLARSGGACARTLRRRRFTGGGRAARCRASRRRTSCLPGERAMRCRATAFALQCVLRRSRALRARPRPCRRTVAASVGACRASARLLRSLAPGGRLQVDARTARLRKANCDRLPAGACSVLAFANVLHLFPYELARLGARRFAFAPIFACALECSFLRHVPLRNVTPVAGSERTLARCVARICRSRPDSRVGSFLLLFLAASHIARARNV